MRDLQTYGQNPTAVQAISKYMADVGFERERREREEEARHRRNAEKIDEKLARMPYLPATRLKRAEIRPQGYVLSPAPEAPQPTWPFPEEYGVAHLERPEDEPLTP